MAASGRDDPHPQRAEDPVGSVQPLFQLDYLYTGDPEQPHQHWTGIVATCLATGAVWATTLLAKGAGGGAYGAASFCSFLQEVGYVRCTLQCDG